MFVRLNFFIAIFVFIPLIGTATKAQALVEKPHVKDNLIEKSISESSLIHLIKKGESSLQRNETNKSYQIFLRVKQSLNQPKSEKYVNKLSSFRHHLMMKVFAEAQEQETNRDYESASTSLERCILISQGQERTTAMIKLMSFYQRHEDEPRLVAKQKFNTEVFVQKFKVKPTEQVLAK